MKEGRCTAAAYRTEGKAAAQQRHTERLSEEKTPYKGDAQNGKDA